jgi:hypothetical protein
MAQHWHHHGKAKEKWQRPNHEQPSDKDSPCGHWERVFEYGPNRGEYGYRGADVAV